MLTKVNLKHARLAASRAFATKCQVIVVGGGHAGCEAASASARTGAETVLIT